MESDSVPQLLSQPLSLASQGSQKDDDIVDIEDEDSVSTEAATSSCVSPWGFTEKYYLCIAGPGAIVEGKEGIKNRDSKYTFKCRLCERLVKCNYSSSSNLKRHLLGKHKVDIHSVSATKRSASTASTSSTAECKKPKVDVTVTPTLTRFLKGATPSQATLNSATTELVVSRMLPFSIVESEDWKVFISKVCPGRSIMCRETLMNGIAKEYKKAVKRLTEVFQNIQWVATTSDCWTGSNR